MRKLLLGGAAALAFAGLASAQTFTLTGDETVTISGEGTFGQYWGENDEAGVVIYRHSNTGNVDLDMVIEGDGWTLEADDLDNNFAGDVSLVTDAGWFAASDLSDFVDTQPESYLISGGFLGINSSNFSAPRWANSGVEGNHSIPGAFVSLYYEAFTGRVIGYQAEGLTLAMQSDVDDGWSAHFAGAVDLGAATVAAQMSDVAMSAMLSIETDVLLFELAYWSYDNADSNDVTAAERTALTLSYTVAGTQTFSMAYYPEHDYTYSATKTAAGDHTGSEIIMLKYEGDFDGFGVEVGMMDWPEADIFTNGLYYRAGSSSSVVLTFDLAENVELGIGYVQSSELDASTSADAEPNLDRQYFDIGLKVEF